MILVTGGSGFIGSHLVDKLVEQGESVTVIDNLVSGHKENLAAVLDKITFHECSIENFDFDRLKNVEAVIHLAAQTSVPYSVENYEESSKINLLTTTRMINYCRTQSIPFTYASSSAIYGGMDFGDDASHEVDLISPYAVDKYAMELYAQCANKLYDLSSMGLRFFNVYGPRQDANNHYSGVISIFMKRLQESKAVQVNGGYQTRDFVYVGDVVRCIIAASKRTREQVVCDSVNVLTGMSLTIDDLLAKLQALIPSTSPVNYVPLPKGDPEKSDGNTQKMQAILEVDNRDFLQLQKGLAETLNFFTENEIAG